MLNRRYLRIKAFQSLYAYWQSDDASAARIEKDLFAGIERTTDLYLSLFLVFGELRHMAELVFEERKKKRLPTPEDLNPNRRFVDNPIVMAIATLSTTGPLIQVAAESPIELAAFGAGAKLVLIAAMVLGRLETLAIIALFAPGLWRD